MPTVTIYTRMLCGYCHQAKRLLRKKGIDFEEIDVSFKPSVRNEMTARANGRHTVPQIFVGDRHLGDCDELYALEARGELDSILSGANPSGGAT